MKSFRKAKNTLSLLAAMVIGGGAVAQDTSKLQVGAEVKSNTQVLGHKTDNFGNTLAGFTLGVQADNASTHAHMTYTFSGTNNSNLAYDGGVQFTIRNQKDRGYVFAINGASHGTSRGKSTTTVDGTDLTLSEAGILSAYVGTNFNLGEKTNNSNITLGLGYGQKDSEVQNSDIAKYGARQSAIFAKATATTPIVKSDKVNVSASFDAQFAPYLKEAYGWYTGDKDLTKTSMDLSTHTSVDAEVDILPKVSIKASAGYETNSTFFDEGFSGSVQINYNFY